MGLAEAVECAQQFASVVVPDIEDVIFRLD